jgi:tetratricopeptide (TPR) repeat protein
MKMRTARAVLFACLMGTASAVVLTLPATPAYAAAKAASVSAPVGKLLGPAQKLMAANDFAGALALVKQAQALPDQTDFDKYEINNFLANISLGTKDYDTADQAYEAMADSPAIPDEEKATTLHNATLLANQAKHYDKSVKYGQAYIALGGPNANDPTIIAAMAQSYYFTNDFTNAAAFAQKAIDATPAGQPPNRAALEIKLSSQIKAKQEDQAAATLEQIVTYYNDADDWGQIIDFALGVKGVKDIDILHIYRLRLAAKANGNEEDYRLSATLANQLGYPGEAEAFLNAGIAAGKVNRGDKMVGAVHTAANSDRAVLPQLEKIARTSGGDIGMKLAETYYGYGRYAEAEAAARAALAKGGAKLDQNEANMLIGESLLMQGKTADAIAAFNAVRNPSAGMAKAQHVWLVFANRKYDATAASQ